MGVILTSWDENMWERGLVIEGVGRIREEHTSLTLLYQCSIAQPPSSCRLAVVAS